MLGNWLQENKINYKIVDENIFEIKDFGLFYLLKNKEVEVVDEKGNITGVKEVIFDEDFNLIIDQLESNLSSDCQYYCYWFGTKLYYIERNYKKFKFNILKYVGKANQSIEFDDYTFLGVHGKYEMLNGSRDYVDWIKKAKFLGIKNLGICEKSTMAGIMNFQIECIKKEINPILGITIEIRQENDDRYQIKLFIENEIGWNNLLSIYKIYNIENFSFIDENLLLKHSEGLTCILSPKSLKFDKLLIQKYKKQFNNLYYQIDTVKFEGEDIDKFHLENLNRYFVSDLQPILLCDAYYLDKDESHIKGILNSISAKREHESFDQYFKNFDDCVEDLQNLTDNIDKIIDILYLAQENTNNLKNICQFKVNTKERHLPKYKMTQEQKEQYGNDEEALLWDILQDGFIKKVPEGKEDEYLQRLETEFEVIKHGNVVNYFLILWDVIQWCRKEGIYVGHARGSAAGSLVSYLTDITQVDPIRWNLLFERFLNKGRVQKSLPDIDLDFPPSRRDDVKKYIQDKYGYDQFCYVGTYTTLQLKGAIKELARLEGVEFTKVNYLTTIIDFEDLEHQGIEELFKNATTKSQIRKFIQEYPNLINDLFLILNAPKTNSIHACATLVLPEENDIYHWMPVRKVDKEGEIILVSEWEGDEIADSGFLKNDILVIEQLDKYKYCLDLIKKTVHEEVDIYNLPLDEEGVLDLFRNGYNSDIFQFGSRGLTSYLKELHPDSIDELIDATALYRPGAMDVNSHNEYILRKFDKDRIIYKFGLKDITSKTYGVLCYQEQVMQAFQKVGGFSLVEADDVRKAIVKKRKDLLDSYKERFIEGALKNGCELEEAEDIWHDIEVHGGYSFNLSHAVSYTLISWVGQWLKYHYPIQFWTTALQFAKEDDVPIFINEIHKLEDIKILPPDINNSAREFTTNYEKAEIYWSLAKIKWCGEKAVEAIISEREKNGLFYSFGEFLKRVEKRTVNKRIVINLILSGAFDDIENIKNKKERLKLIDSYYELTKNKKDPEDVTFNDENIKYEWWWVLRQRELTGFGIINYKNIIKISDIMSPYIQMFIDSFEFHEERNENKDFVISGIITRFVERNGKKGEYAHIEIDSNNELINITLWNDKYIIYKDKLKNCEGKIILFKGVCKFDTYKKTQVLQSNEETILEII